MSELQRPGRPRGTPAEVLFLLLSLAFLLCACPSTGTVVNGDTPPPQLVSQQLWPDLDALLEAGDADTALARIEQLSVDAKGEVELHSLAYYRGRALRLAQRHAEAGDAFEKASRAQDGVLASAARLYAALSWAESGKEEQALASLVAHLDEPGPGVSKADWPELWALLAEARLTAADHLGALRAYGHAHHWAAAAQQSELADFVVQRALALSTLLTDEELGLDCSEWPALSQAAFLDAAARGALLSDDAERTRELVERASASLLQVEQASRAAELVQLAQLEGAPSEHMLIGVLLPLTGDSRRMGRALMAGILQAQGAFSASSGQRMSFLFEDTQGDAELARAAVASLDERGVLAILGPLNVAAAAAAAQEASTRGIPLLHFSLEQAAHGDSAFRIAPSFDEELRLLAEAAWNHGVRRVALVASEGSLMLTLADRFAAAFSELGGELVAMETFAAGEVDHRDLASALSKLSFDALFVPAAVEDALRLSSFLAQENLWSRGLLDSPDPKEKRRFVVYLGSSLWTTETLREKGARYLDGACLAVSYDSALEGDANRAFREKFLALYERQPGIYEALAFDATRLLRDLLLTEGASRRSSLIARLLELQEYDGASGRIVFSEQQGHPSPALVQLRGEVLEQISSEAAPPAALPESSQ
ncbi:MAG: penicillin-binding protein activator [Myxococcota bacterium]|nr:penicillin-binding protein activator [Myxococcota bacterium]